VAVFFYQILETYS